MLFFFHLRSFSSVQWCASQSWRWKREKVATQQPKTPRCANSAPLTGKGWKEIRTKSQSQSPWRRPLPTRMTARDVSKPKQLVHGGMSVRMGWPLPELRKVRRSNSVIVAWCPVGGYQEEWDALAIHGLKDGPFWMLRHPGLRHLWKIISWDTSFPEKPWSYS